jgi:hypothetical protein
MNEFLKMDIFFVVAMIGVVVLTVLTGIALFYLIRLVRTLSVEEEAVALKSDLEEARASIKRGGKTFMSLFGFGAKAGKRLLSKKRRST